MRTLLKSSLICLLLASGGFAAENTTDGLESDSPLLHAQPDLEVTGLRLHGNPSFVCGTRMRATFSWYETNVGDRLMPKHRTAIFKDRRKIDSVPQRALAPGQSRLVTETITFYTGDCSCHGMHSRHDSYFRVWGDSSDIATESNEHNNLSAPLHVIESCH